MNETEWGKRVLLGLEGLVPIAWLERYGAVSRRANPALKASDLFPTDAERERVVEVLVMADVLAVPGAPGARRASSLAALAKAIVMLACCPGGVKFLGHRWWVEEDATWGVRLRDESAAAAKPEAPPDPAVTI